MKHINVSERRIIRACAVSSAPREACGLLVDEYGNGHLRYVASMNQSPDVLSYIIDPEVQRANLGRIEAVVHSHVSKDATPSEVDGAMAVMGLVYVIYSLLTDEIRCWELVEQAVMRDHAGAKVRTAAVWEEVFDTSAMADF